MKRFQLYPMMILLCSFSLFAWGQPNYHDMERMISKELDSVRAGSIKTNDYQFSPLTEGPILNFLKRYERDASIAVRLRVQAIKAKIAMQSTDTLIRQRVVEDFINNSADPDESIAQYSYARLLTFKEHDFSPRARSNLAGMFAKHREDRDFILLTGTAQVRELKPLLQSIAAGFDRKDAGWLRSMAWYACLALARMGDTKKMDQIIAAVELELDPVVRVTRLLPFVAYTRQPEAITLLQKYLESMEKLPSVKESAMGTGFNQYALEYLAQSLDDFPIKPRGVGYTAKEIDVAKQFLQEKGRK